MVGKPIHAHCVIGAASSSPQIEEPLLTIGNLTYEINGRGAIATDCLMLLRVLEVMRCPFGSFGKDHRSQKS